LNSESSWVQTHLKELGLKHQSTPCLHLCFSRHQS